MQDRMEEQLESDEDESGEMVANPRREVVGEMLERIERGEELGPEDLPDDVRKDFYLALRDGRAFNASVPLVAWWTKAPFLAAAEQARGAAAAGEGWWARDLTRLAEEELAWNGAREEGFFWAQDAKEVVVSVAVPAGTRARDVTVAVTARSVRVEVRGTAALNLTLANLIKPDEDAMAGCWEIVRFWQGPLVRVTLTKSLRQVAPEDRVRPFIWDRVCASGIRVNLDAVDPHLSLVAVHTRFAPAEGTPHMPDTVPLSPQELRRAAPAVRYELMDLAFTYALAFRFVHGHLGDDATHSALLMYGMSPTLQLQEPTPAAASLSAEGVMLGCAARASSYLSEYLETHGPAGDGEVSSTGGAAERALRCRQQETKLGEMEMEERTLEALRDAEAIMGDARALLHALAGLWHVFDAAVELPRGAVKTGEEVEHESGSGDTVDSLEEGDPRNWGAESSAEGGFGRKGLGKYLQEPLGSTLPRRLEAPGGAQHGSDVAVELERVRDRLGFLLSLVAALLRLPGDENDLPSIRAMISEVRKKQEEYVFSANASKNEVDHIFALWEAAQLNARRQFVMEEREIAGDRRRRVRRQERLAFAEARAYPKRTFEPLIAPAAQGRLGDAASTHAGAIVAASEGGPLASVSRHGRPRAPHWDLVESRGGGWRMRLGLDPVIASEDEEPTTSSDPQLERFGFCRRAWPRLNPEGSRQAGRLRQTSGSVIHHAILSASSSSSDVPRTRPSEPASDRGPASEQPELLASDREGQNGAADGHWGERYVAPELLLGDAWRGNG